MSEFSKFLSKKITERNLINKQSTRELAREIGISHDYFRRIVQGKVIAPEEKFQEKIATKILNEGEYKMFYDLAAKDRDEIPIDISKTLSKKSKMWDEIRELLEEER